MPELPGAPHPDKIRGMTDLPLSAVGRDQAQHLAERIQAKGGMDSVISSPLRRARQTADTVRSKTGAKDLGTNSALEPWHLGKYEGQESNKVASALKTYVDNPEKKVEGRGSVSGVPGESFGEFAGRGTKFIQDQHASLKPGERRLMVAHYRNLKLAQSLTEGGKVDPKIMSSKGNDPTASLFKMEQKGARLHPTPVDLESSDKNEPGLYLARHGATEWNVENSQGDATERGIKARTSTKRRISASLMGEQKAPKYAGLRG